MRPKTKTFRQNKFLFVLLQVLFFINLPTQAQVTPFKKSVLDSLGADEFNGNISYTFNLSQDGTSSLFSSADLGLMYSTQRSNLEFISSSYFNRFDTTAISNRYIAVLRYSMLSHNLIGDSLVENKIYPEPFVSFAYDANRGINYRWQFGSNVVYAFKPTTVLRMQLGVGLLYELENWQMIKKSYLPYLDSLPPAVQNYLYNTVGINSKGQLYRNNFRANIYTNFMCNFGHGINLNAFLDFQIPFVPPYENLPQIEQFPVVTKRYPRITLDLDLTFKIWKKLNMLTSFTMQYDKGQIPLYVPNFVYSLSQGLELDF